MDAFNDNPCGGQSSKIARTAITTCDCDEYQGVRVKLGHLGWVTLNPTQRQAGCQPEKTELGAHRGANGWEQRIVRLQRTRRSFPSD